MRLNGRAVTVLVGLALVSSCQMDQVVGQREQKSQIVARGIAGAMKQVDVRTRVRRSMRSSLLVNHKLVFQEFLGTADGAALAGAAAAHVGATASEFLAMTADLPPMELLVARKSDRQTWAGGDDLAVGITLDNDLVPIRFYLADGGATRYTEGMRPALFVLQPLEGRSRRIRPQADTPGDVIQERNDGEGGGTYRLWDKDGRLLVSLELADVVAENDRKGEKLRSATANDTTFVDYFWTNAHDGIPASMEIEFRARFYDAGNQLQATMTLRKEGVDPETDYFWHERLISARAENNSIARVNVKIVETDAFFDDNMGQRDFYWGDNGQTRSLSGDGSNSNLKLGWTPLNGGGGGSYYASIVGPSAGRPQDTCHWSVSTNVSDPNVMWYDGETLIGTDEDLYYNSATSFQLQVLVWNSSTGGGAGASTMISISSQNSQCYDQ